MTTQEEIESFQAKISTAKQKKAQAEGALLNIMDSLKRDHGVNSLEEAEAKRISLDAEIETSGRGLDALMEEIRLQFAEAGK